MNLLPHVTSAPNPAFWLDELRLRDFGRVAGQSNDRVGLHADLAREFAGPEARRTLDAIHEDHGPTDEIAMNLLLVSSFLFQRKSAAVADVAEARLPADVVAAHRMPCGRLHRLSVTALLYLQDPRLLVDIDLCDRWHSRRRCVHEIAGHERARMRLGELPWDALATGALADTRAHGLQYKGSVCRKGGTEVLVAFREFAAWSTVRTHGGSVVNGRDDDWTLLLFYEGGNAVDVTSIDGERGTALADAVGRRIWGADVHYRPVRKQLREQDLRLLLDRLADPEDDTFRLVEMVAEVPTLGNRPIITVTEGGERRVELALAALRESHAIGYDWRTVHAVKIGFYEDYRIIVHFPREGQELVLTYSDVDRNKEVSRRFERMIADELGVVIRPRVLPTRLRDRTEARARPRKVTAAHIADVLLPVVEDPPGWALAELQALEEISAVRLSRHCVFRCGDAQVAVADGDLDSIDCTGVVELPFGDVSPDDPFRQEDDAEVTCPLCARVWHPGRRRLPLLGRVRVAVDHVRMWASIRERLAGVCTLEEESEGIATGVVRGKRVYLVYLPLALDEDRRALGFAASFPVCWIDVQTPKAYRERAVGVADVVVDGGEPVAAAWRLGRDPSLMGRTVPAAPPPMPMFVAEPVAPVKPAKPSRRTFTADDNGIWLDGQLVAGPTATAVRKMLVVLWEAARQDDAAGGRRKLRSARRLAAMAGDGTKVGMLAIWMTRLRDHLEAVDRNAVDEILVWERARGYRLGDAVSCLGLDPS